MCRVSARWCSTSCPGASFYCKRKPPRSIGYGRTRRETRRSADESVEDTSRSETRHVGHDSHSHLPSDQVTILWRGPVTESARFHPARSIPRVHYGKYQQSARISACTENAGAEGFSNGPNPVDPTHARPDQPHRSRKDARRGCLPRCPPHCGVVYPIRRPHWLPGPCRRRSTCRVAWSTLTETR